MFVRLTPNEVREAIRAWFSARGVDIRDKKIEFGMGPRTSTEPNGEMLTSIDNVVLEMHEAGPYR